MLERRHKTKEKEQGKKIMECSCDYKRDNCFVNSGLRDRDAEGGVEERNTASLGESVGTSS